LTIFVNFYEKKIVWSKLFLKTDVRKDFFLFTNLEAIYNFLKLCTEMTRGDKKARLRERKRHRARRHSVAVKDEETVVPWCYGFG